MELDSVDETLERLVKDVRELARKVATGPSTARLLAENEPFGDLVIYSLLDDALTSSDLCAHLKIVSNWLRKTEKLYKKQFPEGFPTKDGRFDLSEKPPNFKSRFEIFKGLVETWESRKGLWTAEMVFNDPIAIVKKFHEF